MWFYIFMAAFLGLVVGYYIGVQGEWRRMTKREPWW